MANTKTSFIRKFDNLEQAFIDMVLEMPDSDIEELLRETGEDPEETRKSMRKVLSKFTDQLRADK